MNEVIVLLVLHAAVVKKVVFQGSYFSEAIHFHVDPYY